MTTTVTGTDTTGPSQDPGVSAALPGGQPDLFALLTVWLESDFPDTDAPQRAHGEPAEGATR